LRDRHHGVRVADGDERGLLERGEFVRNGEAGLHRVTDERRRAISMGSG
jgi:hypothetical protein